MHTRYQEPHEVCPQLAVFVMTFFFFGFNEQIAFGTASAFFDSSPLFWVPVAVRWHLGHLAPGELVGSEQKNTVNNSRFQMPSFNSSTCST